MLKTTCVLLILSGGLARAASNKKPSLECPKLLVEMNRLRGYADLEPRELFLVPFYAGLAELNEQKLWLSQEYDRLRVVNAMHLHDSAFAFVSALLDFGRHLRTLDPAANARIFKATGQLRKLGMELVNSEASYIEIPRPTEYLLNFFRTILQDPKYYDNAELMRLFNEHLLQGDRESVSVLASINCTNLPKLLFNKLKAASVLSDKDHFELLSSLTMKTR